MPTKLSRYCEGILEAAWIAAVILVPVFFNIYSSRIFEPDKITLLRSIALLILAAWVVKLLDEGRVRWENLEPGQNPWKTVLQTPMLLPVAGLALIYLVSTIFSVTPRVSLWGSYQRLQGLYSTLSYIVIFAAIAANLRRRAQVERLVTSAIIASLPISLYGVLQRYQIDPVPWGGNVSTRIASNMGNSIFVAAYLIMAFPLTIGRALNAFRAILRDNERLLLQVGRGTVYVFTAALQMIALYMSGSRGPALGWLTSVYLLALLLILLWGRRTLARLVVALSLVIVGFLLVFNLEGGPLESLRTMPAIGRFGHLLDPESKTALVRKYIWEGALDLVQPHQPLEFPDGGQDSFNILRPLIGYGPESMYVAYNPFYPPELGHVERRNASPDRSHNETWDSLVITGGLGLVAYLGMFVSVFYFGLKWLGLARTDRQRSLFLGLTVGGALLGALVASLAVGLEYLGVGLPLGMLGGLWLYLAWLALAAPLDIRPPAGPEADRFLVLAVLLSAIIAHFVEINFGIAIAATRTYFWTFAGLIFAVGYVLPRVREYSPQAASAPAPAAKAGYERAASRGGRARKRRSETASMLSERPWLRPGLVSGLILTLLMAAIGYTFISNPNRLTSTLALVWNAFTRLPNRGDVVSYGVLALVVTTWLAAALVLVAESLRDRRDLPFWPTFGVTLAVSGLGTLFFWIWHAATLVGISRFSIENLQDLMRQVNMVGGLLTNFYFFVFLCILLAARFLPEDWPMRSSRSSLAGPIGLLVALPILVGLVVTTNLRIIYADIAFKMAESFNTPGQWAVATELYREANRRAPNEDHYYLFLGRSYLELAKETDDPEAEANLVHEAETDLKTAQKINPLNTDHTANLARLYSWWASRSSDPAARMQRAQIASDYYERALSLSPNNSTLWGEWAILYMELLRQPDEAYTRLSHALELDDRYNWTQALTGDYFIRQAREAADPEAREAAYNKALEHYRTALETSTTAEKQNKISYLATIGGIRIEMGQAAPAIEAYQQALALGPSQSDVWRINEAIARLYAQEGQRTEALTYAQAAMAGAPEDQLARLQELVAQIELIQ